MLPCIAHAFLLLQNMTGGAMSLEQLEDMEITEPIPINPLQPGEEREDIQEMAAACEALLFVSAEPVPLGDLRRVLAIRQATLERVLEYLGKTLAEGKRGVRLQRHNDVVRLVSAPETALYIDKLKGQQSSQRLSDAALETLALIAYRQPVTRPQIEAIRGVDCNGVTNTLLQRGLIQEAGRLDSVGHPILYGTTLAFLQHFGLQSPDQLPSIDQIAQGS
jgi:segregation and condensation protein B